ncbi:LysR family transcriptional regulator, glycine cleavage system transcriptional activator [Bosea sp. OK403]|uniref:transcriptional regulator GcvA n=1 Tax=Bosea sp. OK403 TaxID=1855286 RepID=UPI0008EF0B45|nr:transcriptional regulator GcvA [Bosea sp. OK403]SFJ35284.1 LysR family transcriptional regulator, glycine cleavage system transcriptional activator [Bosea sp. OK403]
MRRVLPSLPSLTIFEASARHSSFTRAAEELNLSQSAVSKQVQSLETFLGLRLFERIRQRIVLTEAGQLYLARIREALEIMESATMEALAFQGGGGLLNIATLPTFGSRWLAPRIGRFQALYPNIALSLTVRTWPFDLVEENIDIAVYFGEKPWPGGPSDFLMEEMVIPVCAPSRLSPKGPLSTVADLGQLALLHHRARPRAWKDWLQMAGGNEVNPFHGVRFEHFEMIIQAAVSGMGIAIVPRFMIEAELLDGRLITPFPQTMKSAESYYLVCPERKRSLPAVEAFRRWIIDEMRLFRQRSGNEVAPVA